MSRSRFRARCKPIRLNRAEKKNALTGEMYKALAEALRAGDADDGIAVTVILGQPGIFCAGNDMMDFLAASQGGRRAPRASPSCRRWRSAKSR